MDLARLVSSAAILFSFVVLSSCASNLPQDISENHTAPNEHTVSVPYEKAWRGEVPEGVSHPALDPMWKLEINVRELQMALARAGYNPGPIDGQMGKKTRTALTRFQKDNNLEPTGLLDESTMISLEI